MKRRNFFSLVTENKEKIITMGHLSFLECAGNLLLSMSLGKEP